jgi:hypothetical protein
VYVVSHIYSEGVMGRRGERQETFFPERHTCTTLALVVISQKRTGTLERNGD